MRFYIYILLIILMHSTAAFAANKEANVNVILEIEGEYKFEPFKEPAPGIDNFIDKGMMRVVTESEAGLSKYAALNQAMQKARNEIWSVVVNSYISEGVTVKDAIMSAPPYLDFKPKEEEEEKLAAMSEQEQQAYKEKYGKEKKYDFEDYLGIIKECGQYANSGRFYDAVEMKGYACLQVSRDDFFAALDNEKINIFEELDTNTNYSPVDRVPMAGYGAVLINAAEISYQPNLMVRLLSPSEEVIYAGLAGRSNLLFAKDIEEAKSVLVGKGVKKAFNVNAQATAGDTGISISLPDADRLFSALSSNRDLQIVVIYKTDIETEETIDNSGE